MNKVFCQKVYGDFKKSNIYDRPGVSVQKSSQKLVSPYVLVHIYQVSQSKCLCVGHSWPSGDPQVVLTSPKQQWPRATGDLPPPYGLWEKLLNV